MARTGLSKFQVKEARELLLSQGRCPSADAIRVALGNTGSKTTIHRHLKDLEREEGSSAGRRNDTTRTLQDFVAQIAEKLHAEADKRIDELRARYEEALRQKDAQLERLQKKTDELLLKLQELESGAHRFAWVSNAYMEAVPLMPGSKPNFDLLFNNLFGSCRNGEQMHSPGGALFSTRRS